MQTYRPPSAPQKAFQALSLALIVSLIFGAGLMVGSTRTAPAQAQDLAQIPAEQMQLFTEVWGRLQAGFLYTDKLDDAAMMEAAINGITDYLGDENTAYMNPQLYTQLNSALQGEYEGIGATVRKDTITGGVLIVATSAGSPARAKLRQGDIIVQVGGQDITDLTLQQAVQLIRGPAGSSVQLSVRRRGEADLLTVDVQRAKIKRETVVYRLYEGNIGYVLITSFNDVTTPELISALTALDANNLNGLILDMRGDPGGYLRTAIEVASQFLEGGNIVIQKGREGTQEVPYPAVGGALAPDVPLVVMLNEGSASASELVAGALQDRGRALVVGTVSFGKGSIQQWSNLDNGGGMRITTAEFLKPSGGRINKIGIIPDFYVPWTEDTQLANPDYDPQLQEAIWVLQNSF
jgi:carboxyl-terminal processing protease